MAENQGIILDCMFDQCPKAKKMVRNCDCYDCQYNPLRESAPCGDRQPSMAKQLCMHPDASHGDFQVKYSAQLEADVAKFNETFQQTGEELCIACGKKITRWKKFARLFWGPTGCDTSFVYKYCCSHKCWESRMPL